MHSSWIRCGGLALILLAPVLGAGCSTGSAVSKTEEDQFRHPPTTPPAQAIQYADSRKSPAQAKTAPAPK